MSKKKKANPYDIPKFEHMATPTMVVGRKDFERLAYYKDTRYIIHGRKGMKIVPNEAYTVSEDRVIFPTGPKSIIFRKRFSTRTIERKVQQIMCDRSERYDLKFIVFLTAE